MGLGGLMYQGGVRYGSDEGQEFAAQVMEFVRYHAMLASIDLSKARGPFPAIQGSIYDAKKLTWRPPQPLSSNHSGLLPERDWGRPTLDWERIVEGIRQYGIRNAAQTTIAPTGTIATVAGCEGYGCEPVFALAYTRHVNDNGKDLQLTYTSPLFEKALMDAGLDEETRHKIIEQTMEKGSCQDLEEVPENIRSIFVVSQDINAEEHVRMQAALQAFVDNSLSKTINFPETAIEADIAKAYVLAWELGCKGITVYVTGSRQKAVLETKSTTRHKQGELYPVQLEQMRLWNDQKKPRPRLLPGNTISVSTPLGKAFVTINENGGGQPFEVFVNTAKAGSDTAAVSEEIGRLISYILRLASPVAPRARLKEIWRQLSGIGGGRSLGFGPNRVRSLPDGVAQALAKYLESTDPQNVFLPSDEQWDIRDYDGDNSFTPMDLNLVNEAGHETLQGIEIPPDHDGHRVGDLCPECGQAALVNEEGCRKCYACGFSEC